MQSLSSILKADKRKLHGFLLVVGAAWIVTITTGFGILAHEEFTPVPTVAVKSSFPAQSALPLAATEPTLLVFVHPQCPCTRASLHELDRLLTRVQSKMSVDLVFTIPPGVAPGWERGDLLDMATKMPGVHVVRDIGGVETTRFGVAGSGHAILYASSGAMLFDGGITGSRGHEGDNPGSEAIADLVLNGKSAISRTPVFGCSLF